MHKEDRLLQQEEARERVPARAMLLPGLRLLLHRASGGASGPFHHPPQVAIHGVQILPAAQPPRQGAPSRRAHTCSTPRTATSSS
uniref:Uncharacterized protein n=1 Tax=Arundo donax TaxID=35708 RepID=A0A0A9H5C0_ARUDO